VCRACDPLDNAGCGEPSPICTSGFTCVDCRSDLDCGGATTQCVSNVCRGCDPIDDSPCSVSTPQCNPASFMCAECLAIRLQARPVRLDRVRPAHRRALVPRDRVG
jgi:hypothetical protein